MDCNDELSNNLDMSKCKTINELEIRPKSVKFEFTTGEVFDQDGNFLGFGDLINGMLYIDTETKQRERKPILQMAKTGLKIPEPMDGKAKRRQRRRIARKTKNL